MGVIAAYRRVLSNGPLARLLFGEFVSSIGDWLYLVALLVVVWSETNGDPVILGFVGAARIIPYILLSVPAGIVADRFDRRLVLLVTDVARGVIMLLIAAAVMLDLSVWVVVVLAVTATCFAAFFSPTIGAYLPSLVRDESELGPANSAWSSLDNLAFFLGPAFAAVLLALNNLALAFVLNAFTFGVVALVLWRLPSKAPKPAHPVEGEEKKPALGLRETLRPILRPLLGIGFLDAADSFVFGGLGVLTVILAVDVFNVGEAGTGVLNSAVGVGGVIGAVIAGALVLRRRLGPPLLAGAIGLGIGLGLLGLVRDFSLALAAMVIASAGTLLLEIVNTTLQQRIVPDAVRGRTLGVMHTVSVTAYAAGALVLPILAASQPTAVLVGSGVLIVVAAVVAVVLLGKYAIQEPAVDPTLRKLADVQMFAGLPPGRIETALRAATVRKAAAGEVVIKQGDAADNFYVIADGSVEVTQTDDTGPTQVLRRMGPAEFFGEIGLLSGVPRTATVTVVEDSTLITLPGEAFLELVSGGSGLTYQLLNLHRGATAE